MGTTMEWVSCALLILTYYTSRNDPKKGDLKEWTDIGKGTEMKEGDSRSV